MIRAARDNTLLSGHGHRRKRSTSSNSSIPEISRQRSQPTVARLVDVEETQDEHSHSHSHSHSESHAHSHSHPSHSAVANGHIYDDDDDDHEHEHEGHGGGSGHSHGSMNMRGVFLHVLGDFVRIFFYDRAAMMRPCAAWEHWSCRFWPHHLAGALFMALLL